jgi:hypothetical protein
MSTTIIRGRGRGRRGRGRLSASVHRIMRNELRIRDYGKQIIVSPDPHSVVDNPYYPLTVLTREELTNLANFDFTVGRLETDLKSQLAISVTASGILNFKILHQKIWFDTSGVITPAQPLSGVEGSFNNLTPVTANTGALKVINDFPSNVQFAKIGYQWPTSQQNLVLRSDLGGKIITAIYVTSPNATDKKELIIYTHVLWMCNATGAKFKNLQRADSLSAEFERVSI